MKGDEGISDLFDAPGVCAARMRNFDWSASALGPPAQWSASLKTIVKMMLRSRFAMWMAWGAELTFFCNDAYAPTLGIKQDWAIGARSDDVWKEIWPEIGPRIQHVFDTQEATWDEDLLLFLERSGYPEETYHTFSYSPLSDDDGAVRGMLCVVTEETERAITVRRVATLRDLGVVTANAKSVDEACALAMKALEGNPQDFPYCLVRRFDETRSKARFVAGANIGVDHPIITETINIADWPRLQDALAARKTIAVPLTAEESKSLPRGAWAIPLEQAFIAPMIAKTEHGLSGFIAAGINPYRRFDAAYRDFVDLVASQIAAAIASADAYEEERRRAEALAALDQAKTAFFSNVSHEFRTPLTLMLGPLEEKLRRQRDDDLLLVQRNGMRLMRLVNTLLDFSRAEAGRARAKFEPVDLACLTTDLASNFRSAFDKAGLALEVDCVTSSFSIVEVDRDMWEKIVLNLLSNAFKFTFEGKVVISLRREADDIVLEVRDTGVGIPEDQLLRVFERFHRIEGQLGRTHEGTGIGLALVNDLVRLHDGAIEVSSVVGEGTRFIVRIPARRSSALPVARSPSGRHTQQYVEEALRWLPNSSAAQVEPPDPPATPAKPRSHIVLADDNADMRAYVSRLLREAGYVVDQASDGAQALDLIRRRRPDLVLSDVMMPKLDGVGLARALRANDETASLPIILLSARFGEDAEVEGFASGADDYVTKPFAARELIARVSAALSHAEQRNTTLAKYRESEQRFREMADNAPVMIWVTDESGQCLYLNRRWYEFTGQDDAAGLGMGWLEAIHADDRTRSEQQFVRANADHRPLNLEYRLRRHDGAYRYCMDAASPRFAEDGAFLGYIGSVIDITDRKQAEDRRTLLVNELNHRVKNTLAVVQSLAMQGLRSRSTDPGVFADMFVQRLGALARAHDLLTQSNWTGADLAALIGQALAVFADATRYEVIGTSIEISPRAAVTLSMVLHELATNAAKYGALSNEAGRVRVDWTVDYDASPAVLNLHWTESGGPEVTSPSRRGFGSRLIEQGIRYDLDGDFDVRYQASGLRCRLCVPFHALQPVSGEAL